MPIEIRELNIKAYVTESSSQSDGEIMSDPHNPASREAIVAACVEQVLQILKDKEER
jgi:hypothetical protein